MLNVRRFLVIICRFKESATYGGMQANSVDGVTGAWVDKHCKFDTFYFNTTLIICLLQLAYISAAAHPLVGWYIHARTHACCRRCIAFGQVHGIHSEHMGNRLRQEFPWLGFRLWSYLVVTWLLRIARMSSSCIYSWAFYYYRNTLLKRYNKT
jgi:hypothetical protein